MKHTLIVLTAAVFIARTVFAADPGVTYEPPEGKANGKYVVLLAGDEEYRSEEGLPMLAKILSQRHGFKCTVLFSVDPKTGEIDPDNQKNVPGMELLDRADLVFLQFRFRELPDDAMKHFVDYVEAGKPMIAIRTATHAFRYPKESRSPYAKYSWDNREWAGGFGQQILGETWINHYGSHAHESTRGLINGMLRQHPVLHGVKDLWGPTDVYEARNLKPSDRVLVWGLTLSGMKADSTPNYDKAVMPIVWLRRNSSGDDRTGWSMTSTLGAAVDLEGADLRRMFVNAAYWMTGLDVPNNADVDYVDPYHPSFFGFGKYRRGVKPSDHALK